MAAEEVQKFLEDHNRPFSLNDIIHGAKGDFGKAAVVKALEKLVSKNKVVEKAYNKQKVYFAIQSNDTPAAQLKEQLLEVDRQINEITLHLKEVSEKIRKYSSEMTECQGKISLEDAIEQKLRLEKELADVKTELENYRDVEMICPKIKEKIEMEHRKYLDSYKSRKRMGMDMLNSILENYPKSKKHLFEDIGIETDEDVGFIFDK